MFNINPLEFAQIAIANFGAMQKQAEFAAVLHTLQTGNPRIVLEIGAGNGGTSWAWSKLPSLQTLIVIDLPNGPWGGTDLTKKMEYIQQNTECRIVFIKGNSQNKEALEEVEVELGDDKVDVLFIDGDHSYAGVKTDFLTYSPLVKEGGLVIFHDICEHASETGCEAKKFWDELIETCPKENYVEFISEPLNWGGIGVIKKQSE